MHFFFCLLLLCIRIACLVLCFNLSFDVIRKLNLKCSLECSTKRFSREERHVSKATPQNHALTYLSILYIVFVAPSISHVIFYFIIFFLFCTSEFIRCIAAASYRRVSESMRVFCVFLLNSWEKVKNATVFGRCDEKYLHSLVYLSYK